MEEIVKTLDWSLAQTFLAVAETGSLSEAARVLGTSQPTVGRQIRQIETLLDVGLFTRQPRGLALTDAGQALVPHAQNMKKAMMAFHLSASGRSERLSGSVRITASVFVAHHLLPTVISKIRDTEPDIQIDLVASDESHNLLYREADIAVRMYRSEQLDVITQNLGNIQLGMFASRSYLDKHGRPETFEETLNLDLVGYDRSDQILRGFRSMGTEAKRDWFSTRTDHQTAYLELIRQGCGIGFAQINVAEQMPELEAVLPELPLPSLPLWLAAHEGMRQTPRIRRVWDMLYEGLKPFVS